MLYTTQAPLQSQKEYKSKVMFGATWFFAFYISVEIDRS